MAFDRRPLSIADVLNARPVSDPFTVRDCCLVTDGGGAIILVSAQRARDLPKPPVFVLGCGQSITHASISSMPDLTITGAVRSGAQAYAMAGLGASDMQLAMLYDAFTINTILFLEDLGFCPKGEGGRFVQNGAIAPGGRLSVNTNGGGLSYCHPGMYGLFLLIEAVRQLRGACGERQVPGCATAIVHGNGGVLSAQSTVVLEAAQRCDHAGVMHAMVADKFHTVKFTSVPFPVEKNIHRLLIVNPSISLVSDSEDSDFCFAN